MNLNKYLIAAMLAAGMMGAVSAQDNRVHSYKNQQENQVLEEGASGAANYQTKQMTVALGLNSDQAEKIQAINLNHAKEIERAKAECGDDLSGFNQYVDKVAFVRDQELKSVLTPEQFARYTNNKSNKTWLGMDKFKFRSDELRVKENKRELKIKGKANVAPEDLSVRNNQNQQNQNMNEEQSSDAYRNNNNIIIIEEEMDTSSSASAPAPDFHNIPKNDGMPAGNVNAGAPEVKTYPEEIQVEEIYVIEPDSAYNPSNPSAGKAQGVKVKCPQTSIKKTSSKSEVQGGVKTATKKSSSKNKVAKSSAATGSRLSAGSKKKAGTAGKKSTATAGSRKKISAKSMTTASKKQAALDAKSCVNDSGTSSSGSSGQTLPGNNNFYDSTASAKGVTPADSNVEGVIIIESVIPVVDSTASSSAAPAQENFFINKESKAKFTKKESKIKPEKDVKYKITDQEMKLKDGKEKVKENDKELKIKDGRKDKVKSNAHETKIKSEDLKVKIKE
jgi:periplasmic protein CpxP/Spy